MSTHRVAGQIFELTGQTVLDAVDGVLPEPIHEHYVIVAGRRYPPKQVLTQVTGLDRADFTTHQARRILKRLGFTAARLGERDRGDAPAGSGPHGGRQADALAPYAGKWVALACPTEILVAAETPQEVLAWLARHERRASYGMFRVPQNVSDAEGLAPL
jgi:hypothetical protein